MIEINNETTLNVVVEGSTGDNSLQGNLSLLSLLESNNKREGEMVEPQIQDLKRLCDKDDWQMVGLSKQDIKDSKESVCVEKGEPSKRETSMEVSKVQDRVDKVFKRAYEKEEGEMGEPVVRALSRENAKEHDRVDRIFIKRSYEKCTRSNSETDRSHVVVSSQSKIVFALEKPQRKSNVIKPHPSLRSISETNIFDAIHMNTSSCPIVVSPSPIDSIIPENSSDSNNKENIPPPSNEDLTNLTMKMNALAFNHRVPPYLPRNHILSLSTDCIMGRKSPDSGHSINTDKSRLQAEAENIRRNTRLSPRKSKLETLFNTSQPELNCLCSATVAKLVNGEFKDLYDTVIIIDCRFEYEFNGGHIKGAWNFPKEDDVDQYFIKNDSYHKYSEKLCLVFHCEFSSHRGPKSYKRIRSSDRKLNEPNYPDLYYPEMYLLEGGYKQFFKDYPGLCEPQGYVEMKDPSYIPEMRLGLQSRGRSKSQRRFFSQSCSSINLELSNPKNINVDDENRPGKTKSARV